MIQWYRCNDLIRARAKGFATIRSITHGTQDRRECGVVTYGDKSVENTSMVVVCRTPRMFQKGEAVKPRLSERRKVKYGRHFSTICGEKCYEWTTRVTRLESVCSDRDGFGF